MPPMSSLRTFVTALRTGETRTTKALDHVFGQRRGAAAEELFGDASKRGAFNAPLREPFRQALRKAPLPERAIAACIDGWPDTQKEQMRRIVLRAIKNGQRLRFRWGLTDARSFEWRKTTSNAGTVTITLLSPRSSLRVGGDQQIFAAPATR